MTQKKMMKTSKSEKISLIIDRDVLKRYDTYFFSVHPRAQRSPIPFPYHESINTWMILRRPLMNALKQRWKDFIIWFVNEQGYANLHIEKCEINQCVYYATNRRHDTDNSVPKFILDGLVESGMLIDDDSKHLTKLTLQCKVDADHPRTEIEITIH